MIDHGFAQVGTEDLDTQLRSALAKRFKNANGDRINFFASRAPRHPCAQFILTVFVFQNRRQKTLAQCGEERRVAEKARYVDQQIVEQRFDFLFVIA